MDMSLEYLGYDGLDFRSHVKQPGLILYRPIGLVVTRRYKKAALALTFRLIQIN